MKQIHFNSGLQMTDVQLDDRITALEENGSGDSNPNGKFKLNDFYYFLPILSKSFYFEMCFSCKQILGCFFSAV